MVLGVAYTKTLPPEIAVASNPLEADEEETDDPDAVKEDDDIEASESDEPETQEQRGDSTWSL